MATATPPAAPTAEQLRYQQLIRYTSLGAAIICPLVIALPPRKLDFYTLGLLGVTGLCANQVAHEYTGQSLVQRAAVRISSLSPTELPSERAKEVQRRLKVERETQLLGSRRIGAADAGNVERLGADGKVLTALARQEEEREKERGVLEKLWMGNEDVDWKAKRDAREKQALEEGKGYGDLIIEQIWEVWSWGRDTTEETEDKDDKVVRHSEKTEQKK